MNYLLQCYALRKYLEKVGCEATVLNAISRVQEKNNSVFHKKDGIKNVIVNVVLLPFVKQRLRKEKGFADFVENYIPHTEKVVNVEQLKALVDREQYRAIITGSDQVWNPHIFDFDEMFFFPFETKAIKIGYSVSIGESSLEDIRGYSKYAKDFPYVGLREKGAKEKVEAICGHSVVDTVDPVLLLTREDWETFVDKSSPLAKEKYLFCYLIDKKPIKQNMAIAEQIAKERGLKIKYIWMHLEKESFRGNFINDASPVEFLNYMYHACIAQIRMLKKNGVDVEVWYGSCAKQLLAIFDAENIPYVDLHEQRGKLPGKLDRLNNWYQFASAVKKKMKTVKDASQTLFWFGTAETAMPMVGKLKGYNYALTSLELLDDNKTKNRLFSMLTGDAKFIVCCETTRAFIMRNWYGLKKLQFLLCICMALK